MSLRLTHIACCIDRSKAAELALSEAARLRAGSSGSLHARPRGAARPGPNRGAGWLGGRGGRSPRSGASLTRGERRAEIPGAEAQLLSGDPPAEVAARWARDAGVDLIVSAAHQSRIRRALLGRFSRDLADAAGCPVLIARPGPASRAQGAPGPVAPPYRHIAACLDHTPDAGRVIEMTRELGRRGSAALSVVHVVAPPRATPRGLVAKILPMPAARRVRASRLLRRTAAECEGADIVLLAGHPAQAACEWAASAGVDLLVIAPRDHQPRGEFRSALQPSERVGAAGCSTPTISRNVRAADRPRQDVSRCLSAPAADQLERQKIAP